MTVDGVNDPASPVLHYTMGVTETFPLSSSFRNSDFTCQLTWALRYNTTDRLIREDFGRVHLVDTDNFGNAAIKFEYPQI